ALLRAGRNVTLWAFEDKVAKEINAKHENSTFLPGVKLDHDLKATSRLEDMATCDVWILAVPAQHTRSISRELKKAAPSSKAPLVIAAKGIETKTSALLSDVVASELPSHPLAILSGPSFAAEVAHAQPAALTLAIKDKALGEDLIQAMATPTLRLY